VASNCPPSGAWTFNKDNDGWCFTSVAMQNQPTLTVSERFKPEEGASTVLLTYANTTESCGPILGPTTQGAPTFAGSPLVTTTARQTYANGCAYFLTAGATDNIVTNITPDPATPFATVAPFEACQILNDPRSCEQALNIPFCPPTELGRPPLQSQPGGTCWLKTTKGTIPYTC
jgi:hypothetical protein